MVIRTLLLILIWSSAAASAGELEIFGGANSTTYDETKDANTYGVSLRLQYNFSVADSGWIVNLNAPGLGPLASELSAGYVWKSAGDFYFEGGVGAGYSKIRGPNPMVVAGVGYRVSPNFFFDFPIRYLYSLTWMPYLGFTF